MEARGSCMAGGVLGSGACVACVAGGVRGGGGHAWRTVRILLECILVEISSRTKICSFQK